MTKPIWNWSIRSPFSHVMTGFLKFLVLMFPVSLSALYDLLFRDVDAAHHRIVRFYAYCWPELVDEPPESE